MKLSTKHKKIIKEIQSTFDAEMVQARLDAIKYAINTAISEGTVSQSEFDKLMCACGLGCHDYSDLELFFEF